jgi:hypothetical protein
MAAIGVRRHVGILFLTPMMTGNPQKVLFKQAFLVHVLFAAVKVSFLRPVGDKPITRE